MSSLEKLWERKNFFESSAVEWLNTTEKHSLLVKIPRECKRNVRLSQRGGEMPKFAEAKEKW